MVCFEFRLKCLVPFALANNSMYRYFRILGCYVDGCNFPRLSFLSMSDSLTTGYEVSALSVRIVYAYFRK